MSQEPSKQQLIFFSRLESIITEKLELTIRADITTQAIEVNIQSTGVAEEETMYDQPDETTTEEQL